MSINVKELNGNAKKIDDAMVLELKNGLKIIYYAVPSKDGNFDIFIADLIEEDGKYYKSDDCSISFEDFREHLKNPHTKFNFFGQSIITVELIDIIKYEDGTSYKTVTVEEEVETVEEVVDAESESEEDDDEYYYYVKAVPKIAVSAPDVKVHRISSRKNVKQDKNPS